MASGQLHWKMLISFCLKHTFQVAHWFWIKTTVAPPLHLHLQEINGYQVPIFQAEIYAILKCAKLYSLHCNFQSWLAAELHKPGLMSRCTSPWEWMYLSPDAMWTVNCFSSISLRCLRPSARHSASRDDRLPPLQYSVWINTRSSSTHDE